MDKQSGLLRTLLTLVKSLQTFEEDDSQLGTLTEREGLVRLWKRQILFHYQKQQI
jgi:hypothetical protein